MILSTKGVVLHCMDYSETSVIVKIYTEQLGLQSYIGKGVRRKGARIRKNLFAPLSLVTVVANHKEGEGLRVMREASSQHVLSNIASDMNKLAVSIFMSDLLLHAITAQLPDKQLYSLIENAVLLLNETNAPVGSFPLWFAAKLAAHLGFRPQNNYSAAACYFDLQNGGFYSSTPDHPYYIVPPLSEAFSQMLAVAATGNYQTSSDHETRNLLMGSMLDYFKLHISNFGNLKSVQVLSEVLRD